MGPSGRIPIRNESGKLNTQWLPVISPPRCPLYTSSAKWPDKWRPK